MKKLFTGFIALLAAAGLQAQYNDANAEVRSVGSFTGIKVSNGIELVLSQGDAESVAVSAENAEDRNRIKTEVDGGLLKISYSSTWSKKMPGRNKKGGKLRAYVSVRTLTTLRASSGAGVTIQGVLNAGSLDMELSSGCTVSGEVSAKELRVGQSSGAIATLSGRADLLSVSATSGGIFKGYGFAAANCNADTRSGAVVEVSVNTLLDARATTGGLVHYKGSCTVRKSTSTGGAVVNKS